MGGPSYRTSDGEAFALDRILVKLKEGAPGRAVGALNRQNDARTEKRIPRTKVDVVKLPKDLPVRAAVKRYEASPDVDYAEPDFILQPSQTVSDNDPDYPKLYVVSVAATETTRTRSRPSPTSARARSTWRLPGSGS